jgi:hypothetical protein
MGELVVILEFQIMEISFQAVAISIEIILITII